MRDFYFVLKAVQRYNFFVAMSRKKGLRSVHPRISKKRKMNSEKYSQANTWNLKSRVSEYVNE